MNIENTILNFTQVFLKSNKAYILSSSVASQSYRLNHIKTVQHVQIDVKRFRLRMYTREQTGLYFLSNFQGSEFSHIKYCQSDSGIMRIIDFERTNQVFEVIKLCTHRWWPNNYDRHLKLFMEKLSNLCLELV